MSMPDILLWSIGCDPETRAGRLRGILHRHGGRAMAGNGGEKDAYEKECAEQDAGSGGEMNKSAAG